MAKTYRTERDILTIELPIEIPPGKLPEGVAPEKSCALKISAFPAAWNWLLENKNDRLLLDGIIDKALQIASNKMPSRLPKKDINENDFDGAFEFAATKEKRIAKGVHYRGKQKKKNSITEEMKKNAPWLCWFFRFWKETSRPGWLKEIYEERRKVTGRASKDPIDMTYFCFRILYGNMFEGWGETFPQKESFRTTYLTGKIIRRKVTEDQILNFVKNQEHPLNIIVEVCRKLQK